MAAAITPEGDGASWLQQQANVGRIFQLFVAQDSEPAIVGMHWDQLGAEILCDRPVYERFSGFLVHVYLIPAGVKNAGLPLAAQSVLNYLGSLLNKAAKRFCKAGVPPEIKEFFFCLDPKSGSDSAKWLRKVKEKIVKLCFERAVKLGEVMDNSESELKDSSASPPFERRSAAHLLTACCPWLPCAQPRSTWRTCS